MPLWLVFHPPGTFDDEATKEAFAKSVTSHYASAGMPAFYVVVEFLQVPLANTWIGGVRRTPEERPFIRMSVDHIHVRLPNDSEIYAKVTADLDRLLKPHVGDKGYDWEYHIDETERRLWKINGLVPPNFKGEDEKVWVAENRAIPPEEMEEVRQRHGLSLKT